MLPQVDADTLRRVFRRFPTGIAVVTAMSPAGPVGMTANSVTSVSLDPPLVLFCADRSSTTWPHIERAGTFCLNILAEDQVAVPKLFATRGLDRFKDVAWQPGMTGAPILSEVLAFVECRIDRLCEAGDHVIVIGNVQALDMLRDVGPLVFYQGEYSRLELGPSR